LIADTSFLIDIMMKDPAALDKARDVEKSGSTVSVGAPSIFELFAGVALTRRSDEEKSKIMSTVASLPQLPLDFQSARAGGRIYGRKAKAGSKIDPEDAMLAGIAHIRGEPIITRNVKHFTDIEGVKVETY
jgi:tRNA(fMet)-specific endonuclease VapC